jgi:hypothetical protein
MKVLVNISVNGKLPMETNLFKPKTVQKIGWIIIMVLGVLMAANSIVFGMGGAAPGIFKQDTGVSFDEVEKVYPTVIDKVQIAEGLNGTGFLGVSLFAAVIAFYGWRSGSRWAWNVLWILPVTFSIGAAWFIVGSRVDLGGYYIFTTVLFVAGLALSFPGWSLREQREESMHA